MRRPSSRGSAAVAIAAAWLLAMPEAAHAHLVTTGLGPLFDGIMHLAVTPEDLLPVAAISMLVGLRGKEHARAALLTVPVAWVLAGWVGLGRPVEIPLATTFVSFLAFGGLVAADVRLSRAWIVVLAAALGALHGYLNGYEMAVAGLGMTGLIGSAASVFVLMTLASALVVSLEVGWTRIAVRVAGSWVVAVGLLMIGWSLR
ncbi:MAG: HupE/UreJ family protein [Gemmatimonadota bacterium]|nr:HupE/UreJ family protein [Gemmatimonadota bacterium]